MKQQSLLIAFSVLLTLCCDCKNNSAKFSERKPEDRTAKKIPPVYLFDSIQHFFGNENWRIINNKDTSYMLFSRQNDTSIKLYHYKMIKGDSVSNIVSFITGKQDSVYWVQPDRALVLQSAAGAVEWKLTTDTTSMVYRHISPDTILLTERSKKIILNKTITLSDFLARSRYDYLHGTNYANDTITFKRKIN